ncbi:MAG TPA: hypothetical protein DEF43_01930 [Chloroflexus aurantiacus]|uniref:Fibronectin type-III domain-containing protein n=1 Tax=Chloroflexus aurantiacus (strain ATCC 29366 / DSM 635 / J-10-fl) TaxID=324602 RepID=A9WEX4_CHLAA|nr:MULTISPECIES: SBBP repeat-containing protein [Chloroflexus]ABY35289.1 hypothetical protein Caur_2077 [Chloroflexus aurantiacus J-10-fl]RMG50088.1 MAG: hypothetical protein D6716_09600 [Chloroflexota bacterium]HBW65927.1 hypothetical protein [Chloroflexus aurantiacus]
MKGSFADIPISPGVSDPSSDNRNGSFVIKLSSDLASLLASTFFNDRYSSIHGIAIDTQGNVYVAGETASTDFPTTPEAYDRSYNGSHYDGFVSKLSNDLTTILASTFLGGNDTDEIKALTLDTRNNVYVVGTTSSLDFPTSSGAFARSYHGGMTDAFVSRLNGDLTTLLASTFLGGSRESNGNDRANSIVISNQNSIYVAGSTTSINFPTTSGTFDTSYHEGPEPDVKDAFVSKLSDDLTTLFASTVLGGYNDDQINTLALDPHGNVYVAGWTGSSDFPTTPGTYDTSIDGYADAFISKLNSDLSSLMFSTFLGGRGWESITAFAFDIQGNIYVAGATSSADFPTTPDAYNPSFNHSYNAFVSKLNSNLSILQASTFLGGSAGDIIADLTLDGNGDVYVVGATNSSDFPTTSGAYDPSFNGSNDFYDDAFVSKLDGTLAHLIASTFLGGLYIDYAVAVTTDSQRNVYVVGVTWSNDFPATSGVYNSSFNGYEDGFVSKLSNDLSTLLASTFFGGSHRDLPGDIAWTRQGTLVVAGSTASANFPTTPNASDPSLSGFFNAFVSNFSSDLATLRFSTFLGGSQWDEATAIAIDHRDTIYVVGSTQSTDFPMTTGAYATTLRGSEDTFISKLTYTFTKTSPDHNAIHPPSSITLQWQSIDNTVHHYRYCLATTPDCTPTINVGNRTSVTITNVSPDTTYYWQVRACADSDCTTFMDADNGQHFSFTVRFAIYLPLTIR